MSESPHLSVASVAAAGSHRIVPLAALDAAARADALEFCQHVCPLPTGHYEERLTPGLYDAALLYHAPDGALSSVQLLNDFVDGGRRYLYLGPLVSRRHGYAPMLTAFLRTVYEELDGRPVALMAEAQNPLVALLLLYVFDGFAAPALDGLTGLDSATRDALVATFAAHLTHIDHIDWQTLATRSDVTMYRPNPEHAAPVAWFRARGVDFAAGDGQIVVAALAADHDERVRQARGALERAAPLLSGAPATVVRDHVFTWFKSRTHRSLP